MRRIILSFWPPARREKLDRWTCGPTKGKVQLTEVTAMNAECTRHAPAAAEIDA